MPNPARDDNRFEGPITLPDKGESSFSKVPVRNPDQYRSKSRFFLTKSRLTFLILLPILALGLYLNPGFAGRVLGVIAQGGSAVTLDLVLDENFNLDLAGYIRGSQLQSTASSGAPLTVASSTLVSSLNADLLDGQHGSYYLNQASGGGWVDDGAVVRLGSSSDKVGIGTTSPDSTLHVYSGNAGSYNPSVNGDDLVVENSDHTGLTLISPANKETWLVMANPSSVGWMRYVQTGGPYLQWAVNGTARMELTTSALRFKQGTTISTTAGDLVLSPVGNVGVGISSPQYKLDVNGDVNLPAGSVYRIGGVAQSGSSKWTAGAGDDIYRTIGNIGVGTASPQAKLQVESGSPGAFTPHVNADELVVAGAAKTGISIFAGGANAGYLIFGRSTNNVETILSSGDGSFSIARGGTSIMYYNDSSDVVNWNAGALDIDFQVQGDNDTSLIYANAGTDRVGIGTNAPGQKLDVAGGSVRTDTQFISTVVTGTAPLVVASTTLVSNLNADLFDGEDSSSFAVLADDETVTGNWVFSPTGGITIFDYAADGTSEVQIRSQEDDIGGTTSRLSFIGRNDAAEDITYARIESSIIDPAQYAEWSRLSFWGYVDGGEKLYSYMQGGGDSNTLEHYWYSELESFGDVPYHVYYNALNSNPSSKTYAEMWVTMENSSAGSEEGSLTFAVVDGGIAGTEVLEINSGGLLVLQGNFGIGTVDPESKVQISGGGLCVGSDANCNTDNNTEGIVYSSSTSMTVYDVAENYPTKDGTLGPKELVVLDPGNGVFVKRATGSSGEVVLGVISAQPAVHLGGFNGTQFKNEKQVAVGLSGRIPVKVAGSVAIGDPLTASATPGVARKASSAGRVIGYALENHSGSGIGSIQFFINPGWWTPGTEITSSGSVNTELPDSLNVLSVKANEGLFAKLSSTVSAVFESLSAKVAEIATAVIENLTAKNLTVGESEAPAGITVYDRATGDPYCVFVNEGEILQEPGACE